MTPHGKKNEIFVFEIWCEVHIAYSHPFHSCLFFLFVYYFIIATLSPCAPTWCTVAGACKCLYWIELNLFRQYISANYIFLYFCCPNIFIILTVVIIYGPARYITDQPYLQEPHPIGSRTTAVNVIRHHVECLVMKLSDIYILSLDFYATALLFNLFDSPVFAWLTRDRWCLLTYSLADFLVIPHIMIILLLSL